MRKNVSCLNSTLISLMLVMKVLTVVLWFSLSWVMDGVMEGVMDGVMEAAWPPAALSHLAVSFYTQVYSYLYALKKVPFAFPLLCSTVSMEGSAAVDFAGKTVHLQWLGCCGVANNQRFAIVTWLHGDGVLKVTLSQSAVRRSTQRWSLRRINAWFLVVSSSAAMLVTQPARVPHSAVAMELLVQ